LSVVSLDVVLVIVTVTWTATGVAEGSTPAFVALNDSSGRSAGAIGLGGGGGCVGDPW